MRGELFVGTSGFAFKEWKGLFYPEGTSDKKMLAYYSSVLPSVEINYTFRRMPSENTLRGWKSETPESFRLSLKAPQTITHIGRLRGVQELVDEFVRRVRELGERLGAILFQCPPSLRYERERLEGFLSGLSPVARYAMEFRHDSWNDSEARELLKGADVALCFADTDKQSLEQVPDTAGHVYLRLRKDTYSDDDLAGWGKRLSEFLDAGKNVYCYFKHEGGDDAGPRYAAALQKAVG